VTILLELKQQSFLSLVDQLRYQSKSFLGVSVFVLSFPYFDPLDKKYSSTVERERSWERQIEKTNLKRRSLRSKNC